MASQTYFPDITKVMPEPRFTPPQQDFSPVLAGALSTLTGVADNYRKKQQSVQSADRMADALEAEGLTQEAGMYRKAAQAYDINFFSTPEQNEQFNRTLLTDSLKLLQQSRENKIKEQAQSIQEEYYKGLISSRNEASSDRNAAAQERAQDRGDALDFRKKNAALQMAKNGIAEAYDRLAKEEAAGKDIQDRVAKGLLTGAEARPLIAQIEKNREKLIFEINDHKNKEQVILSSLAGQENATSTRQNDYRPIFGDPAHIKPKPEIDNEMLLRQIESLKSDPALGRVGDVSRRNLGSTTTTVAPTGTTTQTVVPNDAIKGVPKDPSAPFSPSKF